MTYLEGNIWSISILWDSLILTSAQELESARLLLDHSDFKHQVHKRTIGANYNQSMSISNDRSYQLSELGAASPRLIVDAQSDTAATSRQMVTSQEIASLTGQSRLDTGDEINELSINLGNNCQSTEHLSLPDREYPDSASQLKAQEDEPSQIVLHDSIEQSISPGMVEVALDCVSRQASQPNDEIELVQIRSYS